MKDLNNIEKNDKIEKISFGRDFNHKIDKFQNFALRTVSFGYNFNQQIEYLPWSVKELQLGKRFNLKINSMPVSLESLYLPVDYPHALPLRLQALCMITKLEVK